MHAYITLHCIALHYITLHALHTLHTLHTYIHTLLTLYALHYITLHIHMHFLRPKPPFSHIFIIYIYVCVCVGSQHQQRQAHWSSFASTSWWVSRRMWATQPIAWASWRWPDRQWRGSSRLTSSWPHPVPRMGQWGNPKWARRIACCLVGLDYLV